MRSSPGTNQNMENIEKKEAQKLYKLFILTATEMHIIYISKDERKNCSATHK